MRLRRVFHASTSCSRSSLVSCSADPSSRAKWLSLNRLLAAITSSHTQVRKSASSLVVARRATSVSSFATASWDGASWVEESSDSAETWPSSASPQSSSAAVQPAAATGTTAPVEWRRCASARLRWTSLAKATNATRLSGELRTSSISLGDCPVRPVSSVCRPGKMPTRAAWATRPASSGSMLRKAARSFTYCQGFSFSLRTVLYSFSHVSRRCCSIRRR
mmetsp:Transcript_90956/g.243924  ORF Transcript_90956/g.243924 Transcript_90956/m.243924 type:complete len:220 (-) Transcript_90956:861-1520(-)